MKIEEVRSASLSDYEVFKHLVQEVTAKDIRDNNKVKKIRLPYEYKKITSGVISYLSKNKTTSFDDSTNWNPITMPKYDDTKFIEILTELNDKTNGKLFKWEKLQLINTTPKSMVEVFAIVEECDNRLDESEIEAIINVFSSLTKSLSE
ncbi:hypothetical protein ACO0SA_002399 [Hanseniaspora valbyensis]